MKKWCSLFIFCYCLLSLSVANSQSNILRVYSSTDFIYSKENSISTSFFPRENGNLQVGNILGYGISYLKRLDSAKNIFLKVGIENRHQSYSIDYFSLFPDFNDESLEFDFTRHSTTLRLGVQKKWSLFNSKMDFDLGVDAISRNYRISFNQSFSKSDVDFADSDTLFFSFDTYTENRQWPVMLEFYGALQYNLSKKFSIFTKFILSPRELMSFNYNITSIDTYITGGIQGKNVHVDEKLNNSYVFRSIKCDLGVSYKF